MVVVADRVLAGWLGSSLAHYGFFGYGPLWIPMVPFDPYGAEYQVLGAEYQALGTKCQVLGTLVLGTWYRVPGTKYEVLILGTKCLVPSTWYQVPHTSTKHLVPSTWNQVPRYRNT